MKEEKIMRERMFKPQGVSEKESFEEQMADLGVKVERQKIEAKAVTPWLARGNAGRKPFPGIRLTKSYLAISKRIAEKLTQEAKDGIPRMALRVIEYEGKRALLFKYDPRGYTITKKSENHNFCRVATKAIIEALHEAGLKIGCYTVKRVADGYLAVQE